MQNKIIVGIDQSYTNTGIAIVTGTSVEDAKIISCFELNFKKQKVKSKTEIRKLMTTAIQIVCEQYKPDLIICERIRLFSQRFISQNYIKATAALIANIVDACYPAKVYSVDTSSWKARVCGHKKGQKAGDKDVSVKYILNRFGCYFCDDVADAICIAISGMNFDKYPKLFKEEK